MTTNTKPCGKFNHYVVISGIKTYVDYINKRLKILDTSNTFTISETTLEKIKSFASGKNLGKIICNSRHGNLQSFKNSGFVEEGVIDGFFGDSDAFCVSHFIDPKRKLSKRVCEADKIISLCGDKKKIRPQIEYSYRVRTANFSDILQMSTVFKRVFETYPTPVFDPGYLCNVMSDNVLFKVAEEDGKILGIASAEMDKTNLNAEITDCATLPEHRGKGILSLLVMSLEDELISKGFKTLYSLSRAVNPGINITLSRLDYSYRGRLINNCHICGTYEDMNIWVKQLEMSE